MTPLQLLAEARQQDVELIAAGERLRYRCRRGALTPQLRADLIAVKDEMLQLLRLRRAATQDWSEAYTGLKGCGWPGRAVVDRFRPDLLEAIDRADEEAERLAIAYANGSSSDGYRAALRRWEGLISATAATFARICFACGCQGIDAPLSPTGDRLCERCMASGAVGR